MESAYIKKVIKYYSLMTKLNKKTLDLLEYIFDLSGGGVEEVEFKENDRIAYAQEKEIGLSYVNRMLEFLITDGSLIRIKPNVFKISDTLATMEFDHKEEEGFIVKTVTIRIKKPNLSDDEDLLE